MAMSRGKGRVARNLLPIGPLARAAVRRDRSLEKLPPCPASEVQSPRATKCETAGIPRGESVVITAASSTIRLLRRWRWRIFVASQNELPSLLHSRARPLPLRTHLQTTRKAVTNHLLHPPTPTLSAPLLLPRACLNISPSSPRPVSQL